MRTSLSAIFISSPFPDFTTADAAAAKEYSVGLSVVSSTAGSPGSFFTACSGVNPSGTPILTGLGALRENLTKGFF